jgi:hypothetical protein
MFIQDTWDLADGGIWTKIQKVGRSKDCDKDTHFKKYVKKHDYK